MSAIHLSHLRIWTGQIRRRLGRFLFGSGLSLLFHLCLFVSFIVISWEWFFPPPPTTPPFIMAELSFGTLTDASSVGAPPANPTPSVPPASIVPSSSKSKIESPIPAPNADPAPLPATPPPPRPKQKMTSPPMPKAAPPAPSAPPAALPRGIQTARIHKAMPLDNSYEELLRLWFAEHQPLQVALSVEETKQVVMRVTIKPDGEITEARVATSSGQKELDNIAIKMIQTANPVPAMPKDYAKEGEQEFLIPFLF